MSETVGVVFVAWSAHADREFEALDERLRRLTDYQVHRFVVDNGDRGLAIAGTVVVPGDNRVGEFSALQAGIDRARADGVDADVWVLANDRFRAYTDVVLQALTPQLLRRVVRRRAAAGLVDRYPATVTSFGGRWRSWLSTNLFVIAASALRTIEPLVTFDDDALDRIVARDFSAQPFVDTTVVSGPHAAYLLEWLTPSPHTRLTNRWYRAAELSPDTWPAFRAKVRSILNEQALSVRASQLGVPVLSVERGLRRLVARR